MFKDQMESYLDEFQIQTYERFRIFDFIEKFDGILSNGSEWKPLLNSSSALDFK